MYSDNFNKKNMAGVQKQSVRSFLPIFLDYQQTKKS